MAVTAHACTYVNAKVELPEGYVLHLKANDRIRTNDLVTDGGCTDCSMSTDSGSPYGGCMQTAAALGSRAKPWIQEEMAQLLL
jgi:hypothetical protein